MKRWHFIAVAGLLWRGRRFQAAQVGLINQWAIGPGHGQLYFPCD